MNCFRLAVAAGIAALSILAGCKTESVQATGIVLNEETLEITKGETFVLTAEIVPEGAEPVAITWSTSNGDIASVDGDGTVSGIASGECDITAHAGPLSASCHVTVSGIQVESVSLDRTELEMVVGTTDMLIATVSPKDAENRAVTWESSDEGIVSVNYLGEVTANATGEASVTATAGGKSAVCKITVTGIPVKDIELNYSSVEMNVGNTLVLVAKVLPENATDKTVVWKTSDEGIVSVTQDGTVTANAVGNAVVSAVSGDIVAECAVSVTDIPVPVKGDFYYSDGTWSTDLDPDKEVIGIVFWTGDPAKNDATLRKEHPECTRGLVVALSGEQKTSWQSGYVQYKKTVGSWVKSNTEYDTPTTTTNEGDRVDFINGYNNSKAYEAFNGASENSAWRVEAMDAVNAHASAVAAPESSSGWYFPSAKEMSLLCAGDCEGGIWYHRNVETRDLINERLALVEGAEQLSPSYYWTSSENTFNNAVILYFGVGYPDLCPKEYDICIVRPVLAF